MEILSTLLQRLCEEEMHLMVTVARQIWLRRNSVVFGGEFLTPTSMVRIAKDQMEAFESAAQRTDEQSPRRRDMSTEKWKKPPLGNVKLNWDAAVDSQNGKIGMGIIVRDHEGGVVARACGS